MKNMLTIAKRDYKSYFSSPIAYVLAAGFLLVLGWMFFFTLDYYVQQQGQFQQMGGGRGGSLSESVIKPLYLNMNVIFLFVIPFITMRLFAEERKNQTIQLLLTTPVTLCEVIGGKFLSAIFFVLTLMGITFVYPLILVFNSTPDYGVILTCFLGSFLLASCLIAVGIFFSSMTENQIVAGFSTFAACLFLWLINWAAYSSNSVWGDILNQISLNQHFNNFGQGTLNTNDLIFYFSFIYLGLFLTYRVLDSYRWR